MVETIFDDYRFGRIVCGGCLGGVARNLTTDRNHHHRYYIFVRLQEPLH